MESKPEINPGDQSQKKPLWEEIKKFSNIKYILVFMLLLLALLGIIVPIIPGIALLLLAIALIKKGWMSKIRARIRLWKVK